MSRRVNSGIATRAQGGPPNTPPADDYLGRLVKYIPSEIIALYIAVTGVVPKGIGDAALHPAKDLIWIFLAC